MKDIVSVIIPAYNAEKTIAGTLNSVFFQTYRPLEVIVIDDGSDDRTEDIVRKYQKSLRGSETPAGRNDQITLTYLYQQNSGPSKARNRGIKAASGQYIAFLDSDDLWTEEKTEKQVELFKNNPDLDIAFTDVRVTRVRGQKYLDFRMFEKEGFDAVFFGDELLVINPVEKLLKTNFMLTPSVMAKRNCFKDEVFFNEERRYAEDWELWLKMSLKFRFGYIDEVCVHVRDEDDGLTSNSRSMKLSSIDILEEFLKKNRVSILKHIQEKTLSACVRDSYLWAGYYFMKKGDPKLARELYKRSMREQLDFRTPIYYLGTFL